MITEVNGFILHWRMLISAPFGISDQWNEVNFERTGKCQLLQSHVRMTAHWNSRAFTRQIDAQQRANHYGAELLPLGSERTIQLRNGLSV